MLQDSNAIELCTIFKELDTGSHEYRFLIIFWIRMAEIYQQFWTNAQGSLPTDMWSQTLLKMGEQSTQEVIVHFIKKGDKYPPTLPEFYAVGYQSRLRKDRFYIPTLQPIICRNTAQEHLKKIKLSLNSNRIII
ncbi:MAG: hypothetical protein RIQ94_376 [Pseudomonadota bacterium]